MTRTGSTLVHSRHASPVAVVVMLAMAMVATTMIPTARGTDGTDETMNLVEVADSNGNLSTLVGALESSGLNETLASTDGAPFTVFGPTDDAFAKLGSDLTRLTSAEYSMHLTEVLLYHVVPGVESKTTDWPQDDAAAQQLDTALEGENVNVKAQVEGTGETSTEIYTVNNYEANVTKPDNAASNGVMHVINSVLLPPSARNDAWEVLSTISSASTFYSYVERDEALKQVLQSPGSLTVFAPSNQAFTNSASDLDDVVDDDEALFDLLAYHVVRDHVLTSSETSPVAGDYITTEGGAVSVAADPLQVNGNGLYSPDTTNALGNNGVVHVIDDVLIPPTKAPTTTASPTQSPDTSAAARVATSAAAVLIAVLASFAAL